MVSRMAMPFAGIYAQTLHSPLVLPAMMKTAVYTVHRRQKKIYQTNRNGAARKSIARKTRLLRPVVFQPL
jgi:hypothetical protein